MVSRWFSAYFRVLVLDRGPSRLSKEHLFKVILFEYAQVQIIPA